jgi:inorganic pyrophosphatase/exopolyphosphatase
MLSMTSFNWIYIYMCVCNFFKQGWYIQVKMKVIVVGVWGWVSLNWINIWAKTTTQLILTPQFSQNTKARVYKLFMLLNINYFDQRSIIYIRFKSNHTSESNITFLSKNIRFMDYQTHKMLNLHFLNKYKFFFCVNRVSSACNCKD